MSWVTVGYLYGAQRPERYPPTPQHWLELNRRLVRWGGGQTWRRLEQLGTIARTNSLDEKLPTHSPIIEAEFMVKYENSC